MRNRSKTNSLLLARNTVYRRSRRSTSHAPAKMQNRAPLNSAPPIPRAQRRRGSCCDSPQRANVSAAWSLLRPASLHKRQQVSRDSKVYRRKHGIVTAPHRSRASLPALTWRAAAVSRPFARGPALTAAGRNRSCSIRSDRGGRC